MRIETRMSTGEKSIVSNSRGRIRWKDKEAANERGIKMKKWKRNKMKIK